jgi:hypothetical protein
MSRMIAITQGSIDNPFFNRETFSETPLLHREQQSQGVFGRKSFISVL